MKVLLMSRYGSKGASSRVRFLQYLPFLRSQGIDVSIVPLFSNAYLDALYRGNSRFQEVFIGYFRRMIALLRVRKFDLVIVEKELFPFFPPIAEKILRAVGVPYVVDYDDALFHRYDCHSRAIVRRFLGRKIDVVMRNSSVVIAGNEYLADRAQRAEAQKIEIIPTVVDANRYQIKPKEPDRLPLVGWIGTPQTSAYLQSLLPVFDSILKQVPARFVAVGARPEDFEGTQVEVWPWSEETEVQSIQQFDIGIMPLNDSPWERGKCGYKLIQYMACGLPVVASPVGVNSEIVSPGENGHLAETLDDWKASLIQLLEADPTTLGAMGAAGRRRVESWYSVDAQASRLLRVLRDAKG